jgi:hypothetical protein
MSSLLTIPIGGRKYPMPETQKALHKVGVMWRKNARISLKMQDKINTGRLYNSMPVLVQEPNSDTYQVNITPTAPYWEYVDKGVQGKSRNIFPHQSKSPFKFGSGKGGPGLRAAINKYVKQKGFQFQSREEGSKGQWLSYDSTAFLVSRAIWHRGLKPILFITGTGERIKKHIVKTIAPAISKDTANALREDLNRDKNIEAT